MSVRGYFCFSYFLFNNYFLFFFSFYVYFLSYKCFSILTFCNHYCGTYCHIFSCVFFHFPQSRANCLTSRSRCDRISFAHNHQYLKALQSIKTIADPDQKRTYLLVGQKFASSLRSSRSLLFHRRPSSREVIWSLSL